MLISVIKHALNKRITNFSIIFSFAEPTTQPRVKGKTPSSAAFARLFRRKFNVFSTNSFPKSIKLFIILPAGGGLRCKIQKHRVAVMLTRLRKRSCKNCKCLAIGFDPHAVCSKKGPALDPALFATQHTAAQDPGISFIALCLIISGCVTCSPLLSANYMLCLLVFRGNHKRLHCGSERVVNVANLHRRQVDPDMRR